MCLMMMMVLIAQASYPTTTSCTYNIIVHNKANYACKHQNINFWPITRFFSECFLLFTVSLCFNDDSSREDSVLQRNQQTKVEPRAPNQSNAVSAVAHITECICRRHSSDSRPTYLQHEPIPCLQIRLSLLPTH